MPKFYDDATTSFRYGRMEKRPRMEKKWRGEAWDTYIRTRSVLAQATDFLFNDSPLSLRFFCASKDAPRGERFVSFKVMQSGFRWPPLIETAYLRRWFREFRGNASFVKASVAPRVSSPKGKAAPCRRWILKGGILSSISFNMHV